MSQYIRYRILVESAVADVFKVVGEGIIRIADKEPELAAVLKISMLQPFGSFNLLELESSNTVAYYTFSADPSDPYSEMRPDKPVYLAKG